MILPPGDVPWWITPGRAPGGVVIQLFVGGQLYRERRFGIAEISLFLRDPALAGIADAEAAFWQAGHSVRLLAYDGDSGLLMRGFSLARVGGELVILDIYGSRGGELRFP